MQGLRIASTSPAVPETPSLVKFSAISLLQYHGSLGEWVPFRDSFESLIYRKESLSNIERFHDLKSALKGDAARALQTLPISDSNYSAAWDTLCVRYEDPNELIDYYVDALFALRVIRRESANVLRELIDDFNNIRSLKSLKLQVDNWDPC